MSVLSTSRLATATVIMALAGCASQVPPKLGSIDVQKSRYAEQRTGGTVEESDSIYVPSVPHGKELEAIAQKAADEYAQALAAMRKEKYHNALIVLQSLSARYPRLSGPLVNQGIIYLELEKYGQAASVLRKAIAVNSRNPYAHNVLGVALRHQGKFEKALHHYKKAISLDPRFALAHFNLAVLAELYLQNLPLALKHFQRYQALQKAPDETVASWIKDLKNRLERRANATGASGDEEGLASRKHSGQAQTQEENT